MTVVERINTEVPNMVVRTRIAWLSNRKCYRAYVEPVKQDGAMEIVPLFSYSASFVLETAGRFSQKKFDDLFLAVTMGSFPEVIQARENLVAAINRGEIRF